MIITAAGESTASSVVIIVNVKRCKDNSSEVILDKLKVPAVKKGPNHKSTKGINILNRKILV